MSLDNLTPSEFSKWYLLGQAVRRMMGKGEQWETVFEGTVETSKIADIGFGFDYGSYLIIDHIGTTVRLTVDGVSRIYTVTSNGTMAYAGNLYLVDKNATDDDFGLVIVEYAKALGVPGALYTRTAGTHTVKIERMMN